MNIGGAYVVALHMAHLPFIAGPTTTATWQLRCRPSNDSQDRRYRFWCLIPSYEVRWSRYFRTWASRVWHPLGRQMRICLRVHTFSRVVPLLAAVRVLHPMLFSMGSMPASNRLSSQLLLRASTMPMSGCFSNEASPSRPSGLT